MYSSPEPDGNVTLLPRQDIKLYGLLYPNVEPRMFATCNDCSKLIHYSELKTHWVYYHITNKLSEQPVETPNFATAVKEKCTPAKNKKKSILPKNVPLPPLFPVWTILMFVKVVKWHILF